MASLITDAEFQEIRDAINDVMDTFALVPCTYRLHKDTLDPLNRDRKTKTNYDDVAINGLIVWDDGTERGQVASMQDGTYDYSEGRVYMKYDDAIATSPPLIDANGNPVMIAAQDEFVFRTKTYDIIGVILVGQLKDTNALAELHIKKRTNKST